jgi:hypothetical protein
MGKNNDYRKDWLIGPIHIIRYRVVNDKHWGVMLDKRFGYSANFEIYFGKMIFVFRRNEY